MVTLSIRLTAIADRVPAGSRLADIGSDHALLPVYLAERGKIAAGIAGEVNGGPYEAACCQVRESGLESLISVRKGDGLAVLAPGEADVVTVAGMGGALIVSILEAGEDQLAGVQRLVLQPNVGEDQVRRYLLANGWWLADEVILEEDGKIYEILVAERREDAAERNEALYRERAVGGTGGRLEAGSPSTTGDPADPAGDGVLDREALLRFGPYLIAAGGEVFRRKWRRELEKWRRVERQLAESALPASAERREAVRRDIAKIEEVLACS